MLRHTTRELLLVTALIGVLAACGADRARIAGDIAARRAERGAKRRFQGEYKCRGPKELLVPDTFGLLTAYNMCLTQAVEIGRVKWGSGGVLVKDFGDFARHIQLNDDAINACQAAFGAWVDKDLYP
jgi:hypothetical protein